MQRGSELCQSKDRLRQEDPVRGEYLLYLLENIPNI